MTATTTTTTTAAATTTIANATDSATTIIFIDSINNNDNNNINLNRSSAATRAITTSTPTPAMPATVVAIPFKSTMTATTPNGNFNDAITTEITDSTSSQMRPQKQRRSLLNFKSLDFHFKNLYTGLRSKNSQSQTSSLGSTAAVSNANVNGNENTNVTGINRMTPYLKIEAVDAEESENLLLDYPQSPYSSRRNSSPQDNNRSSSQLLNIDRYEMARSQAASPSPYFLSPYAMELGNIRRSSTSDITSCKRSGSSSTSDSRRPSTSDLLRRARERRGSEARMGRSVSHSGLPRGARGGFGGGGGRRTSMAF